MLPQLSDAFASSNLNDLPANDLSRFGPYRSPGIGPLSDQSAMLPRFKIDMEKRTPGVGRLQNRELFDELRVDREVNNVERPLRRQFNGEPSRWLWLKSRVFG